MPLTISQVISERLDLLKVPIDKAVSEVLAAIRKHLDMDAAFVSQFKDQRRFFRYVDTDNLSLPISMNASDPLEKTYCQRVVDGRLPKLINDASFYPSARELPITAMLPVGGHISVPIVLGNGIIYGTFCTFKRVPDFTLQMRDLGLVRIFSEFTAECIDKEIENLNSSQEIEMSRYIGWWIRTHPA